jgi:23S rRNA (pseudouridine1915-N3)-methyltransferase
MVIKLVAVGTRMPGWVTAGYEEYAKRLPKECRLALREIAPIKRGKQVNPRQARFEEGQRLLGQIGHDDFVVALEVDGELWSTLELAAQLRSWLENGRSVALLVGGPDGLAEACAHRAERRWSLSRLTLPHPLVRVVIAEQLYRAWSIYCNHPYHRE